MDKDLIVFESPQWQLSAAAEKILASNGALHKKICSFGGSEIAQFLNSAAPANTHAIFVPAAMVADGALVQVLNSHPLRNQFVFVCDASPSAAGFEPIQTFTRIRTKDLEDKALINHLLSATAPKRRPGLKAFLQTGTTLYSENIFKAAGLGIKLDPVFQLAASHLGETRALNVWSILNLFLFHSLISLNEKFDDNANKRVKIQLGVDDEKLCVAISYPVTSETVNDLYYGLQELYTSHKTNQWLAAWSEVGYLEVANYQVGKRGEIIAFFEKKVTAKYLPFVVRNIATNELEDATEAKNYTYKLFGAIKDAVEKGDTTVVAGAKPKVKLSDRMKTIAAKHGGEQTVIKGVTQNIEGGTTTVKGAKVTDANGNTVVSGVTQKIAGSKITISGSGATDSDEETTISGVTQHIGGGGKTTFSADAAESEDITVIAGGTDHINNEGELNVKSLGNDEDSSALENAKSVKSKLQNGVDTEEEVAALQKSQEPADENDILAAIAEVAGQIEGLEEDEELETLEPATPAAKPAAVAKPAAAAAAKPAATAAPDAKKSPAAMIASPQEKAKLDKLFSIDSAKNEKDPNKLLAMLEDRLQSAKDIISQRESLVSDLNKQIEEIMDPTKSGVISGVMDNQKEGLKQNVIRLEAEIVEAEKREKAMMTAVDKAVQAKDEAIKKVKALETKLTNAEQASATKLQKLEKSLETEKQQKAELMKRLSSGGAAGKKAA